MSLRQGLCSLSASCWWPEPLCPVRRPRQKNGPIRIRIGKLRAGKTDILRQPSPLSGATSLERAAAGPRSRARKRVRDGAGRGGCVRLAQASWCPATSTRGLRYSTRQGASWNPVFYSGAEERSDGNEAYARRGQFRIEGREGLPDLSARRRSQRPARPQRRWRALAARDRQSPRPSPSSRETRGLKPDAEAQRALSLAFRGKPQQARRPGHKKRAGALPPGPRRGSARSLSRPSVRRGLHAFAGRYTLPSCFAPARIPRWQRRNRTFAASRPKTPLREPRLCSLIGLAIWRRL
jgi:hypothetical protein